MPLHYGWGIDVLTREVAYSQGGVDEAGNIVDGSLISSEMITPFDIFFNKIAILDVNFFNLMDDGSVIANIRNSVAAWYYVMRLVAAAILLCVLIYVGIRMAISTIASDKAAYKKMLVDWICSLAIIFVLQYIMLFTFSVNEAFIKALQNIDDGENIVNAMVKIKELAFKFSDVNSIPATIVFCMLVAQTLGLLISYFNRMLKIAFLIIIAPLITLTYSIDKMGDGKAQALGTWLKEFIYTVLLQTFHCIIYMAFISMAMAIFEEAGASDGETLGAMVITLLCIKFTKDAEKILGKIFSFSDATSDSSLAVGMAASAMALSKAKGIGRSTRTAINGVRNLNLGGQVRNAKVTMTAMGLALAGAKNADGSRMTKEEIIDTANTKVTDREAEKLEKKNNKKYGVETDKTSYNSDIEARADKLEKETGMTHQLAMATARAEKAKDVRKDKKKEKQDSQPKIIKGARGFASGVKNAYTIMRDSETGAFLRDMGNATMAAGIGTFMGSATYGASGNAFNSIALGMASYKGTNEFLKSSTGTLANESEKILKGFNVQGKDDAINVMRENRALEPILGDNQELQKQLNDLVKFVDDVFKEGDGVDKEKVKHTIKNSIASNMKKDPTMNNDKLMDRLKSDLTSKAGLSEGKQKALTTDGRFSSNVGQLMTMQRHKELYDSRTKAGQLGINDDSYMRIVSRRFSSSPAVAANKQSASAVVEDILDNNGTLTVEKIDQLAKETSLENVRDIEQRLTALEENKEVTNEDLSRVHESRNAIKSYTDEMKIINDYERKVEELKREIEVAKRRIEFDAAESANAELLVEVENIKKEAQEELEKVKNEVLQYKQELERNESRNREIYTKPVNDILANIDK